MVLRRISFSPQRRDGALSVSKAGDILTINGDPFDFSVIPDGASLPADAVGSEWVTGEVSRQGGDLRITLILPHGPNPSASVAFPADIVDPADGVIAVPFDPEPEPEPEPVEPEQQPAAPETQPEA